FPQYSTCVTEVQPTSPAMRTSRKARSWVSSRTDPPSWFSRPTTSNSQTLSLKAAPSGSATGCSNIHKQFQTRQEKPMDGSTKVRSRLTFRAELKQQRWDDHRLYHQSRVTQSLHLFSAVCFLVSYVLLPFNPIAASLLGWIVAMWSRQIGHFFFEPKGFDRI